MKPLWAFGIAALILLPGLAAACDCGGAAVSYRHHSRGVRAIAAAPIVNRHYGGATQYTASYSYSYWYPPGYTGYYTGYFPKAVVAVPPAAYMIPTVH